MRRPSATRDHRSPPLVIVLIAKVIDIAAIPLERDAIVLADLHRELLLAFPLQSVKSMVPETV